MAMGAGVRVSGPPSDGISSVRWDASSKLLVCASWDCTVRVYDPSADIQRVCFKRRGPVLDAAFVGPSACVSGGLDMDVLLHDVASGSEQLLGSHSAAVRCVEHHSDLNLILSGSWDSTVKTWDPRTAPGEAGSAAVPERVYSMSIAAPYTLVVACAKRHMALLDLRKMTSSGALFALRDSAVKHQSRCVRAFNDGAGYVTATIEGRCAVTWLAEEDSKNNFAFKAHRQKLSPTEERIFPIHALAFHPVHGTVATGGGDGVVHTWDYKTKQRVATLDSYATSIAALDYSPDGSRLAIAVSYAWEQGDKPHPAEEIVVRRITDDDVKPRPKAAAAAAAP